MKTIRIFGQPSWKFSSNRTDAAITRLGGQLAPVNFQLGGRTVSPFSIAPWAEESLPTDTPALLKALRGDFFCAPFGGNETSYRGENHPLHGEPASCDWSFVSLNRSPARTTIHLALKTNVREGTIDKWIQLRADETNLYCRHTLSGLNGPMNLGHHAMLKFPAKEGSGYISTSRLLHGAVAPTFESPERGGYHSLKAGSSFRRLDRVPSIHGNSADLTRYPARAGFEDIVQLVHESQPDFAWTAVCFPEDRFVWFSLKDPRVLRSTVFWISNGGRHYAPWNGRHRNVMGIEDVTSYFAQGLSESARPNPLSESGYPTVLKLQRRSPLNVNYIMGVAELPQGFERVQSIVRQPGGILLKSTAGHRLPVTVDYSFLSSSPI
jgi:hypothetical protein